MTAYLSRMRIYFAEMLPIPSHLVLATFAYIGVSGFSRFVHADTGPLYSPYTLIGVWSVFSVFLMLRLMDELKDKEADRALFPDRPLPSGRVRETDIRVSLGTTIAAFVVVSVLAGHAVWSAMVVLGYALLMFRFFFMPDLLRRNLLLALATHNPIIPLMVLHGFAIAAVDHDRSITALDWSSVLPFVAMSWAAFAGWEIARKIRDPDGETDYVTYSKVLGATGAVLFVGAIQSVAVVIVVYLFLKFSLSWAYLAIPLAGFGIQCWAYVRFLRRPSERTARLRPYAELFALCVIVAQVVGFGWPS